MISIKFIKKVNDWYIDLPLYDGDKEDLLVSDDFGALINEFSTYDEIRFIFETKPNIEPEIYLLKIYESNGWAYYRAYILNNSFKIKSFDIPMSPIFSWKFERSFPDQLWRKNCG